MKNFKYIILGFIIVNLFSCDLLDKDPYSLTPETYFNDANELNNFLIGVYSPIMQEHFYGNNYPVYIAGGDDLSFYQRSSSTSFIITANANSSSSQIMTYWRNLYEGINRANMLLTYADKNQSISKDIREKAKAEALFLRSFYYFNLIQGWGDVPLRLTPTSSVKDVELPRTDKQVIYDQIISDIVSIIETLPASNELTHTGTVTQSAAQGILARIYLFRAGEHYRDKTAPGEEVKKYFEQAKYWALQVKESQLHDLVTPYSRVFMDLMEDKYNSTSVRESIWEAEMAGNLSTAEYAAGRIGNVIGFGSAIDHSAVVSVQDKTGMANPGYSYRFIFASLKLYEMYELEADTTRGNWSIIPYEYKYDTSSSKLVAGRNYYFGKKPAGLTEIEGFPCIELTDAGSSNKVRCCGKYRREYEPHTPKAKNYTCINFPILRYSDVLLMLAEAENEVNGPTTLAFECLNKVRTRANIKELSGIGKDDFRDAIKKERAMELCFETLRRWDLIRWGDFYKSMNDMVDYVNQPEWASSYAYAANYYKVSEAYNYFPIPDWEMSTNKLMKQNKGW